MLIDDYIDNHLHVLLRGSDEPWLFPGMHGGHKDLATLSSQITKRIQTATGLRVTVHQFRHAAAALILRAKPGNYEYVRRILGHRNLQTTINFYVGLETAQAPTGIWARPPAASCASTRRLHEHACHRRRHPDTSISPLVAS